VHFHLPLAEQGVDPVVVLAGDKRFGRFRRDGDCSSASSSYWSGRARSISESRSAADSWLFSDCGRRSQDRSGVPGALALRATSPSIAKGHGRRACGCRCGSQTQSRNIPGSVGPRIPSRRSRAIRREHCRRDGGSATETKRPGGVVESIEKLPPPRGLQSSQSRMRAGPWNWDLNGRMLTSIAERLRLPGKLHESVGRLRCCCEDRTHSCGGAKPTVRDSKQGRQCGQKQRQNWARPKT